MGRNTHALALFTKYPEPGVTKTRLIEKNGGNLTAIEAAELYRAMVLDTASAAIHALQICRCRYVELGDFSFCVSTCPADKLPKTQNLFGAVFPSEKIHYVVDKGRNFDEHFNGCYRELFNSGYNTVVCIGGDLPAIPPSTLCRAFDWLFKLAERSDNGAMVIAPCQEGGVSLVGITRATAIDFTGVFYNPAGVTVLDSLVSIASEKHIPIAVLETLLDVDTGEDLAHMISLVNALAYAASFQDDTLVPKRTLAFIRNTGLIAGSLPNTSPDPRGSIDD